MAEFDTRTLQIGNVCFIQHTSHNLINGCQTQVHDYINSDFQCSFTVENVPKLSNKCDNVTV